MLFSQLRTNSTIYVLHKDSTPYVECGQVTSVTAPMPQIGTMQPMTQPLQYTVDVTAKIGESVVLYQRMPANAEFADFQNNGNVFISCTKEGVNAEVQAMRQRSADVLTSVEYHKNVIGVCDKILQQLNPEVAEKAAQQAEITSLKSQLNNLMSMLEEMRSERASFKDNKQKQP